jgi:KDO2-lipid IV(A) lauroyltransferase
MAADYRRVDSTISIGSSIVLSLPPPDPAVVLPALFRLLSRLPLAWVQMLGAALGWLAYLLSPTYRRTLRANLAQACLDEPALRRSAIAHAGRQAIEAAWLWQRAADEIAGCVREAEPGSLARLLDDPRPLLLLTPHLGSFEAAAQYYATQPLARRRPMTVLFRPPRKQALRRIIGERARPGLLLAPASLAGVRMLMRALRNGHTAGILPDQVPSQGEGAWVKFFGRPAYTMTLPARLAAANGARIVFALCERLPGGRGYLVRLVPFEQTLSGAIEADTQRLNLALEALIRQCPTQYLWGYNRYKAPAGSAAVVDPNEAAP